MLLGRRKSLLNHGGHGEHGENQKPKNISLTEPAKNAEKNKGFFYNLTFSF